jgi:hypothetical protein
VICASRIRANGALRHGPAVRLDTRRLETRSSAPEGHAHARWAVQRRTLRPLAVRCGPVASGPPSGAARCNRGVPQAAGTLSRYRRPAGCHPRSGLTPSIITLSSGVVVLNALRDPVPARVIMLDAPLVARSASSLLDTAHASHSSRFSRSEPGDPQEMRSPKKQVRRGRLGRGGEPFAPRRPAIPAGHQSRGMAGFSAAASLMQDRQGRGRSRLSERCVVLRLRARRTHRRNAMPLRTAFCWTAAGVRPSVFATSLIAARSLARRFSVRRSAVVHK